MRSYLARHKKALMSLLLVASLTFGGLLACLLQATFSHDTPNNPLKDKRNEISHTRISSTGEEISASQLPSTSLNTKTKAKTKPSKSTTTPSSTAVSSSKPEKTSAPSENTESVSTILPINEAVSSFTPDSTLPGSNVPDDTTTNQPAATNSATTKQYFETSIKDGETVETPDYSFTIRYLDFSLTVVKVNIYINGEYIEHFNGHVLLTQGKTNTIFIQIYFQEDDQKLIPVGKEYHVFCKENTAPPVTNTPSPSIRPTTFPSATPTKTPTPSSKPITTPTASPKTSPTVPPKSSPTPTAPQNEELSFITSLSKTQTVYDKEFSFDATLHGGSDKAKMTVLFSSSSGQKVISSNNGTYHVTLTGGTNTVRIKTSDEKDGQKFNGPQGQYTIQYIPPKSEDTDPKITVNLSNNQTISSATYNLQLSAHDYNGNYLDATSRIKVKLNDKTLTYKASYDSYYEYELNLKNGENKINISVMDNEGHSAQWLYTIQCTSTGANTPIGNITFSLDADVLTLGNLIGPVSIDIYDSEPLSYAIDRALKKYGFTYRFDGTLDQGFYLKGISKHNIARDAVIQDELIEAINKAGINWALSNYSYHRLYEFDYTSGSGFMYNVNGVYPGYGADDYHPRDGDVVQIRYTLSYGKDLKGATKSPLSVTY